MSMHLHFQSISPSFVKRNKRESATTWELWATEVVLHWSICNANLQRRFTTHGFRMNLQTCYTCCKFLNRFQNLATCCSTANIAKNCPQRGVVLEWFFAQHRIIASWRFKLTSVTPPLYQQLPKGGNFYFYMVFSTCFYKPEPQPCCFTDLLKEIDNLSADYIIKVRTMDPECRTDHLKKIETAFVKSREFGDDKVQLAMQTYEMVRVIVNKLVWSICGQ